MKIHKLTTFKQKFVIIMLYKIYFHRQCNKFCFKMKIIIFSIIETSKIHFLWLFIINFLNLLNTTPSGSR